MKVIHFPYTYYPDASGGTEVYVRGLCEQLTAHGVQSMIAAPGAQTREYEIDGQRVLRYATSQELGLRDLYGEGDAAAASAMTKVLERERPDAVHFHAYTSGVSLRLARAVKQLGLPLIQTYHTPTVSCSRGTLLYLGREICDGVAEPRRCAACLLEAKGVPAWASNWTVQAATLVPAGERQGGLWTLARMPALTEARIACFRELMTLADRVVAVCEWVAEVLRRNGVDAGKILVSRQGAPVRSASPVAGAARPDRSAGPLKLIFLGRLDWTKGLHVVLEALSALPPSAVTLDVYGVGQGAGPYADQLQSLARRCPGARMLPPIGPEEVVRTIAGYDALVVPSLWLETGPLVVYEAFAAGVPVIGSRLGGIAELVTEGQDGLLVPAGSVPAWRQVLADAAPLLPKLRQGIRPPRTMAAAAAEMYQLYRQVREKAA